jgi:hypothetical protein
MKSIVPIAKHIATIAAALIVADIVTSLPIVSSTVSSIKAAVSKIGA